MITLNVNGIRREVQAPDDIPLLYVLRNDLELNGAKFGCGQAQCGACAVTSNPGKRVSRGPAAALTSPAAGSPPAAPSRPPW